MKKSLMILASVALGASMAAAENVESQNIVGFANVDVPAGAFRLVGCNWQTLDSSNTVSIQDLFNANELYADEGGFASLSDQIYVFNGSTYDIYTFGFDEENEVNAWLDNNSSVATKMFSRGDAFWYKRSSASEVTTLTLAGQAPFDASVARTLPTGFTLFSYAFPNGTSFNDLAMPAYSDEGGFASKSDQIYVFNGSTYDIYTFGFDEENEVNAWLDNNSSVTTVGLPVSVSAWYKRATEAGGNMSWTENKPY